MKTIKLRIFLKILLLLRKKATDKHTDGYHAKNNLYLIQWHLIYDFFKIYI